MSNNQTMANKRAILLSAKLRFSSETQPIKDIAVGKAVEQTLLLADDNEGLDLATIQKQGTITLAGDIPVINRADIQRLLERLAYEGRVTEFESSGTKKYRLSEAALQELQDSQEATERRFRIVVEELFSNAGRSPTD